MHGRSGATGEGAELSSLPGSVIPRAGAESEPAATAFRMPVLHCPFPSAINVHADAVHDATMEWVRRFGLVSGEIADRRLDASKFGWLAARAYPDAPREELQLVSDWNTWLFVRDDQCDESGLGRQPEALRKVSARSLDILRGAAPTQADQPLAHALANLRDRLARKAGEGWMLRFMNDVQEYFESNVWEAENRARGVTPDFATYMRMRPFTGGLYTDVDLIDVTERIQLALPVRKNAVVERLTLMANNVVCWANDIISVRKELDNGDVHNLVIVLMRRHRSSLPQAVERAARLHDAEVRAFVDLSSRLPSLGVAVDAALERYCGVLRSWMRGNLDWSQVSGRYRPAA